MMSELTLNVKHGNIRFPKEMMQLVLHIEATRSFCVEVSWNIDGLVAIIDGVGKTGDLLGQFAHAHEHQRADGDALIVTSSNSDVVVQSMLHWLQHHLSHHQHSCMQDCLEHGWPGVCNWEWGATEVGEVGELVEVKTTLQVGEE